MSFDLLPADLLLKIFHQLPFKDRVRLCSVSQSFRDASVESIAKMKSLVINSDLMAYLIWSQSFSSLLESCSPILESMEVALCTHACIRPCNKWMFNVLPEFVYPKLEHLKISVSRFTMNHMKKLISRNQNLRSIDLELDCEFEWPEDIVYDKMDKLKIHVDFCRDIVDLCPTLRPLIGNIPNLKQLMIENTQSRFKLSAQEFSQLLASTPDLEQLNFAMPSGFDIYMDLKAAISTWRLPKLTELSIVDWPDPFSILDDIPASFPRLESLTLNNLNYILDQAIQALSRLKQLRVLSLPSLRMTKSELIDLFTIIPSILTLEIVGISDVSPAETFIDFLASTAAIFRRHLEIRISDGMYVEGSESELEGVLKEMEKSGGPVVTYHRVDVNSLKIFLICFKSVDG